MKTRLLVASILLATSSLAMAGGMEAACTLANGVLIGNDGRQIARDTIYSDRGGYSNEGSGCIGNAVAPYVIERGIGYVMDGGQQNSYDPQTGYDTQQYGGASSTISGLLQRGAMSGYRGDGQSARESAQDLGVEVLLNTIFGR